MNASLKKILVVFLATLTLLLASLGCAQTGLPFLRPTATASPTSTSTFTLTASPTLTPSLTETFTPSPIATFTASPSPTNTPLPTKTPPPPQPAQPGGENFAAQVIALVNAQRAAQGLSALTINWTLMANAQAWSQYMASNNVFYHSGQPVAENIAAGYASPSEAVSAWMNSEGHRANILNPSYTQVGAGYAYSANSQYKHYWTIQFLP